MASIEDFGFRIGSDEAHAQVARPDLDDTEFLDEATTLVREIGDAAMVEVVSDLEKYNGRWHPLGFMIFPLGVHDKMGSLRLHVWPNGLRRSIENGSGVHNHAWYLASLVVAGIYSDARYAVEGADIAMWGDLLGVFRATKVAGQPDALSTDG